jgi:hypothetical protein
MKFVGYAMVPMWVPHHPSPQAEPCTTLESFVHICCECSLIVQADYLILLILSEIQRVFSQFRDVAKVMIMQKKISPNFAIHQRWAHFKKKSFHILDYLWEIIIKMSGELEIFSFKSGQFWPFVPFVPLYQSKSYFSDQNLVKNSLVIFFFFTSDI